MANHDDATATTESLPPPSKSSQTTKTETTASQMPKTSTSVSVLHSLLAGGLAGTCVDVALFPIDTIKTRLQSPQGFLKAGGFRGVYRGLSAAAAGSAPGAALFFSSYEYLKPKIAEIQHACPQLLPQSPACSHMTAAAFGEAFACLVRVPTEVIKSNMQANMTPSATLRSTIESLLAEKNANAFMSQTFGGLYRGYGSTLLREVPFAFIQFPMYEALKVEWAKRLRNGKEVTSLQAAVCGSVAGAIAAAFTTPLDVIKTRLMLGKDVAGVPYKDAMDVAVRVVQKEGARTLLSGLQPRVMWISLGGFVFFGSYEFFRSALQMIA